jgi:hypothetical protein
MYPALPLKDTLQTDDQRSKCRPSGGLIQGDVFSIENDKRVAIVIP